VGANERSVRAWRGGKYPPIDLRPLERALFGDNPAYGDFLNELRRLYRLTRSDDKSAVGASERTASETDSSSELRSDFFDLFANEFKESVAYFQTGPGRVVLLRTAATITTSLSSIWPAKRRGHIPDMRFS
jgi:hypothetical protein